MFKHLQRQIKIEHATYNETHKPMEGQYLPSSSSRAQNDGMPINQSMYNGNLTNQPLGRRASASQKMKFYISRLACNSGSDTPSVLVMTPERPGTPADTQSQTIIEDQALVASPEEYTGGLQQREILTGARKENTGLRRKGLTLANTMNSQGERHREDFGEEGQQRARVRSKADGHNAAVMGQAKAIPMQRHKGTFCEIVKEKFNRLSKEIGKEDGSQDPKMEKIQMLRQRIKEGKLERVVPPTNPALYEHGGRLVPPPPRNVVYELTPPGSTLSLQPRKSTESDRVRGLSRNRMSGSSISKIPASLAAYIGSGADVLDETRREMASKLRVQIFEHPNNSSHTLSRRNTVVSIASSSSSFYCVGEEFPGQEAQTKPILEPKWVQTGPPEEERAVARSSSPWVTDLTRICMFCGRNGVARSRRLCNGCEREFLQRKQKFRNRDNEDNEVKPIPPPKDYRMVLPQRSQQEARRDSLLCTSIGKAGDCRQPPVPPRNRARSPLISHDRQAVIQPMPSHHFGNAGGFGPDELFETRPSGSERNEVERTQRMFKHWADIYGEENFDSSDREGEDKAEVFIESKAKVKRDTDFYSFWDMVLDDGHPGSR